MIACSENCIFVDDGLCNLKEVTKPSSTPIKDCPYFEEKGSQSNSSNSFTSYSRKNQEFFAVDLQPLCTTQDSIGECLRYIS